MRRLIALTLLLAFLLPGLASAGTGEEKYEQFVAALKGNTDQHLVFSQIEAIAILNAGAQVMFEDMPSVSAYCTNVAIQGNLLEVATVVSVAGLAIRPRVTLAVKVEGENVVLELKRMRVGILPMSTTAFLTTIMAVGCPEYMQVYPLLGKVVIRKRGYVRYLDSIEITARGIEVSVLGQ